MKELVSVIVPAYNAEEYLTDTVNNILEQEYQNIEIIIVDDGSTDSTADVCDLLAKDNDRVKVIHTSNQGPSAARNLGIENSNGNYILPVDSDDLIEASYIKRAVEIMVDHPNMGIVYCKADLFGATRGEWKLPDYSLTNMLLHNCIFATAMFRKCDWEKIGGYSDEMQYGLEDYDFWLSVLELGREVYRIPDILFHYRIRSGGVSDKLSQHIDRLEKMMNLRFERHMNLFKKAYYIPDKNKKIVIYGAGDAGKTYFQFLKMMDYRNIVLWVDKKVGNIQGFNVTTPMELNQVEFDEIIIAINNHEIRDSIASWIIGYLKTSVTIKCYISNESIK